ncbi:MAG: hemerythrin domain-containing protein [Candidatus Thiodiazotropha endolucinida]
MAKAIKIIRNEHAGLAAIYRTLSVVVNDVVEGRTEPSFELFHSLVDYLKSFMYRYHHPKENYYLFPAVIKRNPGAASLVEVLETQHKEGGALLKTLEQALERYEKEGKTAQQEFVDAFERYHQFEWKHMSMEEREIIPMAKRSLTEEDWEAIDKVFLDHSDPLFGDKKQEEYKKLFDHIAKVAPAPYGLGS